ncbi:MAG: DUF3581 family protein [Gammaproteobacteria bacterium]|nr:DUF3581 family protein [Gammaproteobacteria bacterium]MCB1851137.1 DUF3581 family protein [Gammaproteobacteria bacterium]MCP5416792.1 DUF3581 family protein [Chromatiaceae bacterium]
MFIESYYSEDRQGIRFSRQQASDFAKKIADDFNPLHNPDAKLFCVPGDLLFALVLTKYGVSKQMRFTFLGMVDDRQLLHFSRSETGSLSLIDDTGKSCLEVECSGEQSQENDLVESLTRNYVAFSGHTFPHILIPLMSQHQVMINPARPIIIYQSMEIDLERMDIPSVELQFTGADLEVDGKRGNVRLDFHLNHAEESVGKGRKYMAMRGLRPFDQVVVDEIVASYMNYKAPVI